MNKIHISVTLILLALAGAAWAQEVCGDNQCQCTLSDGTPYCGVQTDTGCACEVKS